MIKILLLFITLFFSFNSRVDAALCDKEHITKLKELAGQVEVSYEYLDYSEEILSGGNGSYSTNIYKVSINLIDEDLYLIYNKKNFYHNDNNNGIIEIYANSGYVDFSIHTKTCADYKLRKVDLLLPKFNIYSYKEECKLVEEYNLDVCNPWYQGTITDSSFKKAIDKYLNLSVSEMNFQNFIIEFFKKYYLYIVSGIIFISVFIILFVNYRKKSVLE